MAALLLTPVEARILSDLRARIRDVCNEYGVLTVSPNFEAQPEDKVWVPKGHRFAAPAAPSDADPQDPT